ncbi:MAG: type II secretion system protein [Planctomycetota bacterium]|nr:type II secretion system protein [Planctomycetota bacterium]
MMKREFNQRSTMSRSGFTLIESVMSIIIVSVMFVAAMSMTASSRVNQKLTADHNQGLLLADMLMTEILQEIYIDPQATNTLATELDELTTTRATWNDVDDYNGWSASPPQNKDGTDLPGLAGWERIVTISYVNPNNLTIKTSGANTGVKLIEVTIKKNGRKITTLSTIRTGPKDHVVEDVNPILIDDQTGRIVQVQQALLN